MKVTPKKHAGNLAEQKACEFLLTKGLQIITRNFKCSLGEIDLIMQDGEDIVFVEVRARSSLNYGNAIESINKTKQKKVIKSAIFYLKKRNWLEKVNYRFDVIGFSQSDCEWIKNAFSMSTY